MSYLIGLGVLVVLGVGVYFYLKKHPDDTSGPKLGSNPRNTDPKG